MSQDDARWILDMSIRTFPDKPVREGIRDMFWIWLPHRFPYITRMILEVFKEGDRVDEQTLLKMSDYILEILNLGPSKAKIIFNEN